MISVIVPAKDSAPSIQACLDALLHQSGVQFGADYEVIVVDDGSTDDTAEKASAMGVRVLCQPNAGPASARNLGAQHAAGDLLLFTDADCIPSAGWVAALAGCFRDAQVAAAKGVYTTQERGLAPRFVQCEYAHKYARMARLERIDFVDTYSAAYRKAVFLQNGGFDLFFPVPSVEDQEFSFRLARQGCKMVFCPAASVQHRHDLTIQEYVERKFGIGYWKTAMLRWMPERAFSDSHTPPEQRWQIVLLGLAGLGVALGLAWPVAWWMSMACLALFYLSSWSLFRFIYQSDKPVLAIAPVMLLVRAAALGCGIGWGVLKPPRRNNRP